jgi:chorismate mutase
MAKLLIDDRPRETLSDLRDRLDAIDAGLHRLLRERFEIVTEIARAKGPGEPVIRPAREAAVIENRLAGHSGPLPDVVLVHLWRTIMAAACMVQRPFRLHVAGALDVARFLYGPVDSVSHGSGEAAVAALAAAPDDVAVVDGAVPWWAGRGEAHVIARVRQSDGGAAVVVGGVGVARGTGPSALVLQNGAAVEMPVGALEPDAVVLGRYHPFPIVIPVSASQRDP